MNLFEERNQYFSICPDQSSNILFLSGKREKLFDARGRDIGCRIGFISQSQDTSLTWLLADQMFSIKLDCSDQRNLVSGSNPFT